MRNELEYLAEIESYILGTIDNKIMFEQKMSASTKLTNDVMMVKNLVSEIKVKGLRNEIQKAHQRYFLQKTLKWITGIITILLVITGLVYILTNATDANPTAPINKSITNIKKTEADTITTSKNNGNAVTQDSSIILFNRNASKPEGPSVFSDHVLRTHSYYLSSDRNEIIETPEGIIFSIPAWSFKDAIGNTIMGNYQINIKEAIQFADIMKAGLSTWSDSQLLETGGMFYFQATQDGKELTISEMANLTVSVPKISDIDDMELFDGVRKENGVINWTNPQPKLSFLTPVPMDKLNFYPPQFESMLAQLGIENPSKQFKDSVYLSFSGYLGVKQKITPAVYETKNKIVRQNFFRRALNIYKKGPEYQTESIADTIITVQLGVNPISVLAFWNTDFNETIIATREFEARMQLIHLTCSDDILSCYIDNLDKSLHYCDSLALKKLAVGKTRESFMNFYYQRVTALSLKSQFTPELVALMAEKQKQLNMVLQQTSMVTIERMQRESLDEEEKKTNIRQEILRTNDLESVKNTLCKMDESQNKSCKKRIDPSANANYNTYRLFRGGWKNVDKFTSAWIDNKTAPSSKPNIMVLNFKNYDVLEGYVIPKGKLSFIRMQKVANDFVQPTISSEHTMVVIGYKNNQCFSYLRHVSGNRFMQIELQPSSAEAIQTFIQGKENDLSENMIKELEQLVYKANNISSQKQQQTFDNFIDALMPVVFPCSNQPIPTRLQ